MKNKYLLISGFSLLLFSCGKKQVFIEPEYRPLTEAVYASGQVIPNNEYQVVSLGDGVLIERFVNEGDTVKKDQPLFRIKSETMDARYQTATEAYKLAQDNYGKNSPVLSEIESGLKSSRDKMVNDSTYYAKAKILWSQNAISKNEFDRAELNYTVSKNDYSARLQTYERTKNQLYLDLKNAQGQLTITREDKDNYIIRSYIDGMVYEVYKEPGETARRNEPIAMIGDASDVYIQLEVDEEDITKIKTGQEVLVKMDIYKGRIFHAKVTKIYPRLQARNQSFRVDAVFTDTIPRMYSGITAEANIIIQQKDRALVVPKAYLVGDDSLWVKQNGKKEKIKIVKGAENYEFVEVLEGVNEGVKVLEP